MMEGYGQLGGVAGGEGARGTRYTIWMGKKVPDLSGPCNLGIGFGSSS